MRWTATGDVSTSMAADITRHLESLNTNLWHCASSSVCMAVQMSWGALQSGNAGSSRQWAQVVLDYSWEQLNIGKWEDVDVVWREVYATAALLKALGLAREGERQKALEVLDRGILLGAPILDSALQSFATCLTTSVFSSTSTESSCVEEERESLEGGRERDCDSRANRGGAVVGRGGKKKIIFRNYKLLQASDEVQSEESPKRPKLGIDVHNLASRKVNVPLTDSEHKIPLVYLPSLDTFHQEYMVTKTPVTISGAMDTWPAYAERKWRLTYHYIVHCTCLTRHCILLSSAFHSYI